MNGCLSAGYNIKNKSIVKDKIKLEVMSVLNQEADIDTVVDNISLLLDDSKQRELLIAYELKLWINPTQDQIKMAEQIVDMYLRN
jgi:endonuclease V-like protein UPF0215 family